MGGAVPVVEGWAEAYEAYGTGGVMAAMLEPAGGFGKFVLVLLALSVIGNIGISSKHLSPLRPPTSSRCSLFSEVVMTDSNP